MDQTANRFINDMFWNNKHYGPEYDITEWAILIHASIINKVKNIWHKFFKNDDWKAVEYTLQIGPKCYEMFLVVVPIKKNDYSNKNTLLLQSAIENSQFSFPWEEEPTLFINVELFHAMVTFIRIHKLQAHILKIEEKPGITCNDGIIKVVTFNKSVYLKLDIIQEYEDYIFPFTRNNHQSKCYYMGHAFEWLQPHHREHFKIPISDDCYSVFPIIFNQLRTLNYINELNIFDLVSIRLALCDDCNPSRSHLLKFDIDFIIRRELAKIIKNNHLDLNQYLIAKNYEFKDLLIGYLVYEFQHLFETVKMDRLVMSNGFALHKIESIIKIVDNYDVLNIIKQKSNIEFDIDGTSYDRMSLSLFLDLVECHNVDSITLDTNYRWINDECNLNRFISNSGGLIRVELVGTNIHNFFEEFISSLKTTTFRKTESGGILLDINCIINDYTIFDNLTVSDIDLNNAKIDTRMLQDLHKCNLKSRINVFRCTFVSTRQNWALLNNLGELFIVRISEDEGIWQSLFEFILDEMLKTNAEEFQFYNKHFIKSDFSSINLGDYIFAFDELKSKLEIRARYTNEIIDLFEEKLNLQPDEKYDYDFYQ